VATQLGLHAERLARVRALQAAKGRRVQQRFAFEGPTLLEEARLSGFPIDEVFCTTQAYQESSAVHNLEALGIPTFIVPDRAMANISDLASPSGIVAVAPMQLKPVGEPSAGECVILILADINDPSNAGTLLRSADAFGCRRVIFGRLGVDPYHPKVVRGSMGAIFRVAVALGDPEELTAITPRLHCIGLSAQGAPVTQHSWRVPTGLVVGNERQGLGRWRERCEHLIAIPMTGRAESLSAAVAGSIGLYEATARRSPGPTP
jgi:RNA methyltransferase, TrmH family